MLRLLWFCLGCALATALPTVAPAVEMADLYEAEVPVADQGAAARVGAARAALAEVLVKVTGNAAAPSQPAFQPLLRQAGQWLQRYQYRATPGAATPQTLVATFDRQIVNQRIYDAGQPVWGSDRPRLLLWLAVEDAGGRALVAGERRSTVQAAVNEQARRRGLPLGLPSADGQEQAVSMNEVWAQVAEPVLRASQRYGADGVLLGRLTQAGPERWRARWTLRHAGNSSSWEGREGSLADVAAAGVDGAAAELAQRYALVLRPGVTAAATLMVDKVNRVQDYARVSRYLESLDAVSAVAVERVEGHTVVYRLQVRGDLQGLARLLAMGNVLGPAAGSAAAGELQYQLLP